MSNTFDQPLIIHLKPQFLLVSFIWLSHCLAVAILFLPLTIPLGFRWLIGLLVLASLAFNLCRHRQSGKRTVKAIGWERKDGWFIQFTDGSRGNAELMADSYVSVPVIIVRLKCDAGRVHEFVLLDFVKRRENLRRLRVRMRQEPLATVTSADSDSG